MNKIGLLLSGLLLLGNSTAMGQGAKNIRLNEILTNNTASIQDEYGTRQAWIEMENKMYERQEEKKRIKREKKLASRV